MIAQAHGYPGSSPAGRSPVVRHPNASHGPSPPYNAAPAQSDKADGECGCAEKSGNTTLSECDDGMLHTIDAPLTMTLKAADRSGENVLVPYPGLVPVLGKVPVPEHQRDEAHGKARLAGLSMCRLNGGQVPTAGG
jgi:hypothetical protein